MKNIRIFVEFPGTWFFAFYWHFSKILTKTKVCSFCSRFLFQLIFFVQNINILLWLTKFSIITKFQSLFCKNFSIFANLQTLFLVLQKIFLKTHQQLKKHTKTYILSVPRKPLKFPTNNCKSLCLLIRAFPCRNPPKFDTFFAPSTFRFFCVFVSKKLCGRKGD